MSGRILVHVGLPKTATTALQAQYFPWLSSDDCRYLGVYQPRNGRQEGLFLRVRHAVTEGLDIAGINEELRQLLDTGANVIVSEEMFTVSSLGGANWRVKLQRLAAVLRDLNYTIMVTVREPVAGSFSYYVELEPRYRSLGLGYVAAVKADDAMQIYDYSKLLATLDACFAPERMFFKRFEDVTRGDIADIGGRTFLPSPPDDFVLEAMNNRRSTGGRVFTGRQQTLADALRSRSAVRGMRHLLGQGRTFRAVRAVLRWFDAITLSERSVALPTEGERKEVATMLDPGWRELQERMSTHA